MSESTEDLTWFKDVFERAKNAPRDKEGVFDDLDLHGDVVGAIVDVGKMKLKELTDEVYPYLDDEFSEFREEAVKALGYRLGLQLPEFKDKAYNIWLNDSDPGVRITALKAWSGYYVGEKDPFVLKVLYDVLKSEDHNIWTRVNALYCFMVVSGELDGEAEFDRIFDLDKLKDQKLVTKGMNWEKINHIMDEYVNK